jgi:signal recognition particle receptor subunit beta
MRRFKNALRQAADEALQAGQITEAQYDKIVLAQNRKELMAALRAEVYHQAKLARKVPRGVEVDAVNWQGLLDFLKGLLPLLAQIIALFSAV